MSGDNKPNVNEQIALYILQERVNELKEQQKQSEDRNLSLFTQLTENQRVVSERLLVVETNNEHVSTAIIKLQKESSLQTKLLTGILVAVVGAVVSIIVKAAIGM